MNVIRVLQLQNQWVVFSVKIWLQAVKRFQLNREIKLLNWPAYDPHLLPASQDHRFRQWATQGITSLCRIITEGNLNSFEDLRQSYELDKEDFYRYLQFRHFFLEEIRSPDSVEPSTIIQIFIDAYS